jgi:beta-glucosidase
VGNIFNAFTANIIANTTHRNRRNTITFSSFWYDVIHAHRTISNSTRESAVDLEAMERSARIAATEASAEGIN